MIRPPFPAGSRSMRLSVVLLLASVLASSPVLAQASSASADARSFAIAPGTLVDALHEFSRVTGIQIAYAAAIGDGIQSPGAIGTLSPAEALSRLLTGTGLTYRFTGPNAVTLEAAPQVSAGAIQLGPVRVEGGLDGVSAGYPAPSTSVQGTLPKVYAGGQVARGVQLGLLGNQDFLDTPFSVSSYTADTVRDLAARTPLQILVLDPSVSRATGGTESTDQMIIRGFPAFGFQYTVNGLISQGGIGGFDAEAYERIELLKGPSALLNGTSASVNVGGTVNLITKKATDDPITRVTGQLTSGAEGLAALDLGRRFGAAGEFGVRTNLVYSDGHRDVDANPRFQRILGTIDLDYRGDGIRAYVHGSLLHRYVSPYATIQGLSLDSPDPTAEPPKAIGIKGTAVDVWEHGVQGGIEADLASATTLSVAYGKHWGRTRQPYAYFLSFDPVSGNAQRVNGFYGDRTSRDAFDATLRSHFTTGPLTHRVAVSATFSRAWANYRPFAETDPFAFNIFHQIEGPEASIGPLGPLASFDKTSSYGVADTVGVFNDRLLITAGLRRVTITSNGDNDGDGVIDTFYTKSKTTPAVGALFKISSKLSLYGNYIQGLDPGQTAPRNNGDPANFVSNPGEVFAPTPARQIEAGAKLDLGTTAITAAAFSIQRPSFEVDAVTKRFGPIGQQTNKGFELNVFGTPLPGVRLLAGYAYIDAVLSKTIDPTVEGKTAAGVPKHTLALSAEWDPPFVQGLTLVTRSRSMSSQFYDSTNTVKASGHTTVGLGANYRLPTERPIVLRAFVENVSDERFYVSFARGRLAPETPRTFTLSAEVNF